MQLNLRIFLFHLTAFMLFPALASFPLTQLEIPRLRLSCLRASSPLPLLASEEKFCPRKDGVVGGEK